MTRQKIDPKIRINDLASQYPTLIDFMQEEYGFHCMNCMFSEFDTLQEGAYIHGIEGEDFDDLIHHLENTINGENPELEIYPAD